MECKLPKATFSRHKSFARSGGYAVRRFRSQKSPSRSCFGSLTQDAPSYKPISKVILKQRRTFQRDNGCFRTNALTESAELPMKSTAPPFKLPEPLTGRQVSLDDFKEASALLIIFMCNHCPFVKLLKGGFVELANDYQNKGVQVVGISSNSVEVKPMDAPDLMAADAKEQGYPFPYLYDEDQAVAQAYQAVCTPEFFLFDKDLKLQYHGQFDKARPSNGQPVTGADVRKAIDNLLEGKEPETKVTPSIGCNIKWHPGKEPAYAT